MYPPKSKAPLLICFFIISLMFLGSMVSVVVGYSENPTLTEPNIEWLMPAKPTIFTNIERPKSIELDEDSLEPEKKIEAIAVQETQKSITIPLHFSTPKVAYDHGYSRLALPETTVTGVPGEPEVLTRNINLKFKPGTKFQTIEFTPEKVSTDTLIQQLIPVRKPIPLSEIYKNAKFELETIEPDQQIYSTSEPFPNQWFSYDKGQGIDLETNLDTLFLNLRIYPVRYAPTQNEILYTTQGTVTVTYTESIAHDSQGYGHSRTSPITENYKLLIISPDKKVFIENLTRLAQFKTQTDIPTKLVNLSEISGSDYFPVQGRDLQEQIKYFIFNAKKSWNISYVILAGDIAQIPHRMVFISGGMAGDTPADLYYADVFDSEMKFDAWDYDNDNIFGEYIGGNVDRADLYPDVFLGRLPADTGAEIEVLVDKIIYYETTTSGQPWFDNITLIGSNTFAGTGTPEGEYAAEYISENYMQDFIHTKIYETDTYDDKDLDLTNSNIVDTLDQGSGFVTFHDHGSPQAWFSNSMFNSNDASTLTNGDKLPFLNFDACSTGSFDDQDCIAEKVMLNPDGGSIISIGSSRIGWGAWGTDHIKRRSGYFNVHLYEMYNNGEGTVGRVFSGSKISYLDNVGVNDYMDYMTLTEYTLFGDPSLSIGGIPLKNITISCQENTSHVTPTNTVNYNIEVSNNGTLARPIKLNVGGIPENWTAELNESFLIVPGMSIKKVTLTVTASETAMFEQIAHIEVFAYAAKNKARTISTMTHTITDRIYGVELNTTLLLVDMYPGEEKGYWLKLWNWGNAIDIINLTAALTEPKAGWVFNFSVPDVQVLPYDYQIVTLMVTPPLKTIIGSYEINVIGTLLGLQAQDSIIVRTNILRTYGIDLTTDEELSRKYNPGQNFTYHLNVANQGNDLDKIECIIQRSPKTWDISLSRVKAFNVNPFSEKVVELFFQIPNQTVVGTYMIRVYSSLTNNESHWAEIDIEIIVNQTYDFEISIDESDVIAEPSETKEFNLTLNHLGNGDDGFEVVLVDKPREWHANLSKANFEVVPYSDYWVTVRVTPHPKTITNKYSFKLKVTLMGTLESKFLNLSITVKPISKYEVICIKNKFSVAPGDAQSYRIYISNYGNHEDEISLNITDIPLDWNVTFNGQYGVTQNIALGAFNSTTVTVKTVTDSKSIAGEYWFCVNSKLESTAEETKVLLYTTISPFYDVALESDSKLIRTHPGEDFTITINISNRGNTRDDITREIIGLPSSWGFQPTNYTYNQLGAYSSKTEKIIITVPEEEAEREVNLTIRVYSQNQPEDTREEDSNVYVESKDKSDPGRAINWSDFRGMFIFWILPIILIIIIIIVMGFLIRKQRKEYKEDMEIIKQMRYGESPETKDQEYAELYGSQPGPETPTIPGSLPKAKTVGGRRQLRKRAPPPKPSKKKHKIEEAGPGEEPDDEDISEIECPACGKLVSLDEDACPFCGEVFEAETDTKNKPMADDYEVHLPGTEEEEFEEEFEETEDDEDWEDLDADEMEELDEIEEVDEELEELDELEDLDEDEGSNEFEELELESEEEDDIEWETDE